MKEALPGVVQVTGKYVKAAGLTLAKAFQEYPVSVFFEPDPVKRRKTQPGMFRDLIRTLGPEAMVYGTSPGMEGVAVWVLMDKSKGEPKHKRSFRDWLESLHPDVEKIKKRQGFMDFSRGIRDRVMPERYWYLQLLGVDPEHQGKGLSTILLKPMLELAAKQGLPCFLETQRQKNVAFYGHFGFVMADEGTIPNGDVYSWALVKK